MSFVAITVLVVAACSGSRGPDVAAEQDSQAPTSASEAEAPTSSAVEGVDEPAAPPPDDDSTPTPAEDDSAEEKPPAEEAGFLPVLGVELTEPGPRPLLSWQAIDGAAGYQLVILGSDGTPYWAWAGPETEVFVGGFDDPDAVGPWVHETMSWTVAALDAEGIPLAVSDPATLIP